MWMKWPRLDADLKHQYAWINALWCSTNESRLIISVFGHLANDGNFRFIVWGCLVVSSKIFF